MFCSRHKSPSPSWRPTYPTGRPCSPWLRVRGPHPAGPREPGAGQDGRNPPGRLPAGPLLSQATWGGPLQEPREGTGPGALGRSAVTMSTARRVPRSPVDRFPSPRPHEDPSKGSTGGRGESQLGEPQPPPSHGEGGLLLRPVLPTSPIFSSARLRGQEAHCLKRKLFLRPSGVPIGMPGSFSAAFSVLRTEALQPTGRRDALWVRVQKAQFRGQEKGTWIHPFPAERSSYFPV